MEIIIASKTHSSWSIRAWILLKKSSIQFTETIIDLSKPDYKEKILKFSPAGKVPVLKDGDICVWDSLAIANYLDLKHPTLNIWPKDIKKFAIAQSAVCEMHSGFFALRTNLPCDFKYQYSTPAIDPKTQADIARILSILEDLKTGSQPGWLLGEFSIVDAFFIPVVLGRFLAYNIKVPQLVSDYIKFLLKDKDILEWLNDAQADQSLAQNKNPIGQLI